MFHSVIWSTPYFYFITLIKPSLFPRYDPIKQQRQIFFCFYYLQMRINHGALIPSFGRCEGVSASYLGTVLIYLRCFALPALTKVSQECTLSKFKERAPRKFVRLLSQIVRRRSQACGLWGGGHKTYAFIRFKGL